jgi:hypothetical protein
MKYSLKTISAALIRSLAREGKNNWEKFLLQQNVIQFELILLIRLRSKVLDKDLTRWIEGQTLGNLIKLYKICANLDELHLISLLEKYNERRVYLVHKILKDCNFKRVKRMIDDANSKGLEIMKKLDELLAKEIHQKLLMKQKGK